MSRYAVVSDLNVPNQRGLVNTLKKLKIHASNNEKSIKCYGCTRPDSRTVLSKFCATWKWLWLLPFAVSSLTLALRRQSLAECFPCVLLEVKDCHKRYCRIRITTGRDAVAQFRDLPKGEQQAVFAQFLWKVSGTSSEKKCLESSFSAFSRTNFPGRAAELTPYRATSFVCHKSCEQFAIPDASKLCV